MTENNEYCGPLAGLNVIDFGHYYAGPMAGMLLADQGANVIRIVRPGEPELPSQQYRLLNRNKKLLALDLKTEEGKAQALSLIEKADVVIENFRPGVMKRLGLDYASVKGVNAGLVYLSMPGFASADKERAHIQAWEGVVAAATGVYSCLHVSRSALQFPPVYTAAPLCSALGALEGGIAVMAALIARRKYSVGTLIETSLYGVGLMYAGGAGLLLDGFGPLKNKPHAPKTQSHFQALADKLVPNMYSPDDDQKTQLEKLDAGAETILPPPFYGTIFTCADGRKMIICLPDHKEMIDRFFAVLGIAEQVKKEGFSNQGPWIDNDTGNNVSHRAILKPEKASRLIELVASALRSKSGEEWDALFIEHQIAGGLIRTRSEWFNLDSMKQTGLVAEMGDGDSILKTPGRTVDVSGPGGVILGVEFAEPEWISAQTARICFDASQHTPLNDVGNASLDKGRLLEGLSVVDMTNIMAGPISGFVLAQYGAEVIKANPPVTTGMNNTPHLQYAQPMVSSGKLSLLADFQTPDGKDVLERLVARSDVVIHNRIDSAASRLGIAHDQLQQINPSLVTCQLNAFGGTYRGGWEDRVGFDWQAQCVTGLMVQYGSEDHPYLHGMAQSADLMGGLSAAFVTLLGVYQQRTTGWAGEARASLTRAVSFTQLPWMIEENGSCDWGEPRGQFAKGPSWQQRIYACKDGWIYVGAGENNAQALAELVADIDEAREGALEALFAMDTAAHWISILHDLGVGAHKVLVNDEDYTPEIVNRVDNASAHEVSHGNIAFLHWEDHPCGQPVSLSALNYTIVGEDKSWMRLAPAPYLGQHTREILGRLGFDENAIDALFRLGTAHEYLPRLKKKGVYFYEPMRGNDERI